MDFCKLNAYYLITQEKQLVGFCSKSLCSGKHYLDSSSCFDKQKDTIAEISITYVRKIREHQLSS